MRTSETQSITETDITNVYVYDPNLKKNPIDIGSLGDVNVADELTSSKYTYEINFTGKDKGFTASLETGECQGMLDMVFARYYNNKAADIVVYKNYDFEYECTQID